MGLNELWRNAKVRDLRHGGVNDECIMAVLLSSCSCSGNCDSMSPALVVARGAKPPLPRCVVANAVYCASLLLTKRP